MTVTLSRAYGAGARALGDALAARLGWRVVDDELPVPVPPAFGERLGRALGAIPELAQPAPPADDDEDETRREIVAAVRAAHAAGSRVIVGRGAGGILGAVPDVVRVFVTAPLPARIARIRAAFGLDDAAARAEIARVDEARRGWARSTFGIAWGDPSSYDLVVDTERLGIDGAAEAIAAAVRARERG